MAARLFCLASVAVTLFCAGSSIGQQLARDFFDNTVIHEIRIDLDPDDWAALKRDYVANTYFHAGVSSGLESAGNVGIRSRGNGSRSPAKPNLDVNIDKYVKKQRFAGVGFFILKANNQDPSMMHEAVAFEFFRKMGLPAPREAPARVYVNGAYLGFYTIVEHEDEDFLTRNLGESGGDLFEWNPKAPYNFEDLGDDPSLYAMFLDPKTNGSPDYQPFLDMVKAINHSSDTDFVNSVSRYLDLNLYLTHSAAENALAEIDGIWDGVFGTNNIFLYHFQGQDEFLLITWDKDLTFMQPQRAAALPGDNVLARRLLAMPEYRSFYYSQLAKAADLLGGPGGWADQEVTRMYTLIRNAALDDPYKQCIQNGGSLGLCGPDAFEQCVMAMRDFIAVRAAFINDALASQNYRFLPVRPTIYTVSAEPSGGNAFTPGSTVRIQGTNFGDDTAAGGPSAPRSIGRSFVAVEGIRAQIVARSPVEVVIRIPADLPSGTAAVAVAAAGVLSNTKEITIVVP
jgi:spore coat protein H